jgi:NitT/TauT family transport system substrate-binding protein
MLSEIRDMPAANSVFDSSQIPGEILDLTIVNTDTLTAHPEFGNALVGAWYETVAMMTAAQGADAVLQHMASASGTSVASFQRQLETTHMFAAPAEGVAFVNSEAPKQTMELVAAFSWDKGLLGPTAPDPGFVGIEFADGSVWGNPDNVQLRFTDRFMRLAAEAPDQ